MATALRTRLLALAERRLPALTRLRRAESLPIRLDRRRIYVLPTPFGIAMAILLFVMLLGALNYGNNAALLLTCLLGAACGASLFVGFRGMSGLVLEQVRVPEAFAGDPLDLRLEFSGGMRARPGLRLELGSITAMFQVPAGTGARVELDPVAERRGWWRPGRACIWTDYPLGLFRIWSWIHPDVEFLVWPRPEAAPPPLPVAANRGTGVARRGSGDEYAGLRDYRATDAPRLIAWKASARHDALLVRETEHALDDDLVLDYARLSGLDHEARIARLAAWVLAAETERRSYRLRLPEETIGPALGTPHRDACLRALALSPGA